MRMNGKSGFTMIELITVISILLLLMGAITTSVTGARRRAMTQQAISEAQQLTDAILAYENYDDDHSLKKYQTSKAWKEATEDSLQFILGGVENKQGKVPVLFNAAIRGGNVLDPWGTPYQYMIADAGNAAESGADQVGSGLTTYMYLPNLWRLKADEQE